MNETKTWDKHQAAAAWGVNPEWARLLLPDIPGAEKIIEDGRAKWVIPAGTPKPTKTHKKK